MRKMHDRGSVWAKRGSYFAAAISKTATRSSHCGLTFSSYTERLAVNHSRVLFLLRPRKKRIAVLMSSGFLVVMQTDRSTCVRRLRPTFRLLPPPGHAQFGRDRTRARIPRPARMPVAHPR